MAVRALFDRNGRNRNSLPLPTHALPAGVEPTVKNYCEQNQIDMTDSKFVKWIERDCNRDGGGAERDGLKIFAAPEWNHRPEFSVVELAPADGGGVAEYYYLQGILKLNSEDCLVVGYSLQNCDLRRCAYHFRMPILCLRHDSPLKVIKFSERMYPVVVIPHLVHDASFDSALQLRAGDKIFHHNIFVTRGSYRYWDEWKWLPACNGNEVWG